MTDQRVEPAMTELDALELRITQSWTSGDSRTICDVQNPDLDVLLSKGTSACEGGADGFTSTSDDGYVVIALGVDGGEHDAVHYRAEYGDGDMLDQTIATLTAARDAVRKVSGS